MRRSAWLAPLLLALTLLVAPATASADVLDDLATDAVVLAADAEGAPLGPDPMPRDAEGNAGPHAGGLRGPGRPVHLGRVLPAARRCGHRSDRRRGLWYLLVVRPGKQQGAS